MVNKIHNPRGAGRKKEVIKLVKSIDSPNVAMLYVDDKSATGDIELIQRLYKTLLKRQKTSENARSRRVKKGDK